MRVSLGLYVITSGIGLSIESSSRKSKAAEQQEATGNKSVETSAESVNEEWLEYPVTFLFFSQTHRRHKTCNIALIQKQFHVFEFYIKCC